MNDPRYPWTPGAVIRVCVGLMLCQLSASNAAHAADQGIAGKKLLLKTGKVVLLSKDPGIGILGSDPVGGSDSSVSFDDGTSATTFSLPKASWSANGAGTLYKYKNAAAPGGASAVKIAKLKSGLLKVVAKGSPFAVPTGASTIDVVFKLDGGSNTYCMTFTGTGDGTRFLVKDAAAGTCAACPTGGDVTACTNTATNVQCQNCCNLSGSCLSACSQALSDECSIAAENDACAAAINATGCAADCCP